MIPPGTNAAFLAWLRLTRNDSNPWQLSFFRFRIFELAGLDRVFAGHNIKIGEKIGDRHIQFILLPKRRVLCLQVESSVTSSLPLIHSFENGFSSAISFASTS